MTQLDYVLNFTPTMPPADNPEERYAWYWDRKAVCSCKDCEGPKNGYVGGWISGVER